EFVGDGGELDEEIVSVLLAAGAAGLGVEVLNCLGARVEEFDEEDDAVAGDKASIAHLIDLLLGEGRPLLLGVERRSDEDGRGEDGQGESEKKSTHDRDAIPTITDGGHEDYPRG